MTPDTSKRAVIKKLEKVRAAVAKEIYDNGARGGSLARGLASEGWAGGYMQAVDDIEAALRHGYPSDPRGYWKDPA